MSTSSPTLELACELISRPSVTPEDAGCQELLIERLEALGFRIERLPFAEVTNLWARRGNEGPLFCFAGHTDVVPPGPAQRWTHPPFQPTLEDGYLYRARRRGHERQYRRLHYRSGTLYRPPPGPPGFHRPADHLRRGRALHQRDHPGR